MGMDDKIMDLMTLSNLAKKTLGDQKGVIWMDCIHSKLEMSPQEYILTSKDKDSFETLRLLLIDETLKTDEIV